VIDWSTPRVFRAYRRALRRYYHSVVWGIERREQIRLRAMAAEAKRVLIDRGWDVP